MVSFGCTGGQHRSVYLAEQLAKHLRSRNIEVVVRHRELEKLETEKIVEKAKDDIELEKIAPGTLRR